MSDDRGPGEGCRVELQLLGDVEVLADGREVELGPIKQRHVLAALAADANRTVPAERLIERVWGTEAPLRARSTLSVYVSRLRQKLPGPAKISQRHGGYALEVEAAAVDVHRFHDLVRRARTSPDPQAVELLDQAVGLWRTEALAGLSGDWAEAERGRLARERLEAEHDLIDARLRLGHGAELVPRLADRFAEDPLDERVVAQYLLALYRAGRSADALAHYRDLRERLVRELGTDPGAPLRKLHQQILATDPTLDGTPAPAVPVPRQLPAAPAPFIGRDDELDRLDTALRDAPAGTVVVTAIAGSGGFGKTWLALHWAHRHAGDFPDGQLFVDLRGFSADGRPMAPAVAVRGFLDALGVQAERIPVEPHAQVALFRSLVADKRLLLVLDNAVDVDQVTPLLPGGPASAVVVTSRNQLPGLITGNGAQHVCLDVLGGREAHALLARRLDAARLAAEPAAVAELIDLCGGFPLALSVVASHLHTRPHLSLAALAAELRDLGLGVLGDDPDAGLPAVLSWSYRALTAREATVFSLLGIAPGAAIGLAAATSLTGLTPEETRKAVRGLERASLITQDSQGRLRMHDLIRRFAAETAERLPEEDREAALRRVVDFYLHTAHGGERALDPHRPPISLDAAESGVRPRSLPDAEAAFAWFDREHANLLAAQRTAADHGWHETAWRLGWTLTTFHTRRGYVHDEVAVCQIGLSSAGHLDAPAVHTLVHRLAGMAFAGVGRFDDSIEHLHRARELAQRHDDLVNLARTHRALAWVFNAHEDVPKALDHATSALHVHRLLEHPVEETFALCVVAWYTALLGDWDRAREHCEVALARSRQYGLREGEASVFDTLGHIEHHTGRHHDAIRDYHAAIALHRALDCDWALPENLDRLGHPHVALAQHDLAREAWQEAGELFRRQGRDAEADRMRRQIDSLPPGRE